MGRPVLAPASLSAVLLLCISAGGNAAQNTAVQSAAAAMQRGDFQAAEKTLRSEVETHAGDSWAVSLLGVALDNQKRLPEAEEFHRRAVALSPRSAEILNNYGTHQWIAGQFDKAEITFASALAAAPGYFNVLFNLGVMATHTGHYERAHEVLESALKQQPQNVDVLYRLACVEEATRQWETAAMRLAQAAKLDPRRADVQKLLALTTTELGALDDAAAAWDRYLKLEPNDQIARRESAYTAAKMGKLEQGISGLEAYLARYPDDPVGHFELAQAERSIDAAQALGHLDRALALDPDYVAARTARGSLYYQEGKPESAVTDLELAASRQTDNAANLDRLGQTYQALDRTADAVRVLRRAAELAPKDSRILLHFARALADAGQTAESKLLMDRFRQLGPEQKNIVPAGLVEYLSLSAEQRQAEYRARVEKVARDRPEDPAAQVAYLKSLIEDGNAERVAAATRRIAGLTPDAAVLADAGRALLEANHYALARDLLRQAVAAGPRLSAAGLDLAIATFHALGAASGATAGLELMDRLPEAERGADYYLARAQMLDASGKPQDAAAALDRALGAAPKRPDLYRQAIAMLAGAGRAPEALRLIVEAARHLPENREILLLKATTLEFARQSDDAGRLLMDIRNRWPEWSAVWLAHGIILNAHQRYEEARQALQTAVALGERSPETYYYLADCEFHSGPARKDAAAAAVRQALDLSPADPWIQSLAGRIAFAGGEFSLAVERQRAAVRLRPRFIEAHQQLAQAYGALGRKAEMESELQKVRAIRQGGDDAPPYLSSLFQGSLMKGKSTHEGQGKRRE
ncbi:MAG: tetratricopeptide repeat protein [Candidatus Solibacter sp.]|nr:tetratricopeptide repeat protein [Candidatus Solibacter sp.]